MLRPFCEKRARIAGKVGCGLAAVVLSGCRDVVRPDPASGSSAELQQAQVAGNYETLDEEFARLATVVPGGFAGMYFDASGQLVVALTDVTLRDAALTRLKEAVRALREERYVSAISSSVRIQEAEFRYDDLKRWREQIEFAAGGLPGLVMTDIDEVNNRIELGFEDPRLGQDALRGVLLSGRIPPNAVRSIASAKVQVTQVLSGFFASIPGGVHAYPMGSGASAACTIGVNVMYNGNPAFITNSHCTLTQGAFDGGSWGHAGFVTLGAEIADPPSLSGTCPVWVFLYPCRRSDAAVIGYNGTHPHELGQIARTNWFGWYPPGYPGSDTIDVAKPRFPLVSPGYATSNPVLNEHVHRMGRMTGWLAGPINQTCVNVEQTTGWWMLCQYRFNGGTIGGDSGAPIFYRVVCPGEDIGSPWNCAKFVGVHWGGSSAQSYFSPVGNILQDFSPATFAFVP